MKVKRAVWDKSSSQNQCSNFEHDATRHLDRGGSCKASLADLTSYEASSTRLEKTTSKLTLVGCIDEDAIKAAQKLVSQSAKKRQR